MDERQLSKDDFPAELTGYEQEAEHVWASQEEADAQREVEIISCYAPPTEEG